VVAWRSAGEIVSAPLPFTSHGEKIELFWRDETVVCKAAGRAWKVRSDFRSVIEIPPDTAKSWIELRSQDEESMLFLVKQAGGSDADVWCKSCALTARRRKASVGRQ
jgi:hypothetical protein